MAGAKPDKRHIPVFIASPGDLGPERQRFRETVNSLNEGFGDGANVTFETLGWEDTLSSFGTRTQSVINQEVDRCEVFILVLNRRWGQEAPDTEYSSYTEEEFHRALQRFEKESAPTIFVFFKRVDPASEGDPGPQLRKVMDFRQSLEDTRKVLYRYFDDTDSFGGELNKHLRAYARNEFPELNATVGITLLPQNVKEEMGKEKQKAETALAHANAAKEQADIEAARALDFALTIAEDAAEAALEGKLEKARQRFAEALLGTSNLQILSLAFRFYHRTGDIDATVSVAERCLAASEPHSEDRAVAYGNLGIVHKERGELDEAVTMYQKVLALSEELDLKEGMTSAYVSLGNVHQIRDEPDEAVTMYQKALTLSEELDLKEGMARAYGNLGNVHKERGELDEAMAMHQKALALSEELDYKIAMAHAYWSLGQVHQIQDELDQTRFFWNKSLGLFEQLESPFQEQLRQQLVELD